MSDSQVPEFDFNDVPDAPVVRVFPAGVYEVDLKTSWNAKKEDPEKHHVLIELHFVSAVEVSNPDPDLKKGDKTFISYYVKHSKAGEIARSQLKIVQAPIGQAIGSGSSSAFMEATKEGIRGKVTLGVQKSSDPKYSDSNTIQAFVVS